MGRKKTLGEHRLGVDLTHQYEPETYGPEMAGQLLQQTAKLVNLISQVNDGALYDPYVPEYKALAIRCAEEAAMWAQRAANAPMREYTEEQVQAWEELKKARIEQTKEVFPYDSSNAYAFLAERGLWYDADNLAKMPIGQFSMHLRTLETARCEYEAQRI